MSVNGSAVNELDILTGLKVGAGRLHLRTNAIREELDLTAEGRVLESPLVH